MPVLFSSSTFPLLPYIVCDFLQPTAVPYIHPSSPTHTRTPLPHQPTDPHRETTPSLSFSIASCVSSRGKSDKLQTKQPLSTSGTRLTLAILLHRRLERVVTGVAAPDFGTIPRVSLPACAYRKGRILRSILTNSSTTPPSHAYHFPYQSPFPAKLNRLLRPLEISLSMPSPAALSHSRAE